MARQRNEDPAVPEGVRKFAPTRGVEPFGGGKGIPVNQQAKQLALFSETADNPSARAPGADDRVEPHHRGSATLAVPKSETKDGSATPATMEEVASRLREAFQLIQLGVSHRVAWRRIYAGRKSPWALSHDNAVNRGLRNAYFAERGLVSLAQRFRARLEQLVAPPQLTLALG